MKATSTRTPTHAAQRTGGVAVVEALEAAGVELVFGIPGTHNLELYRGLAASHTIAHVGARHEQGLGYAADGYARVTGLAGVCFTTSGPALANICAAAATAYADSVPMLIVAPGPPTDLVGGDHGLLHEMKDQEGMLRAIVDTTYRPGSIEAAVDAIGEAFARWHGRRRRPVYVEIPIDVLDAPWDGVVTSVTPDAPVGAHEGALREAAALLDRAERPVVLLGSGAREARAPARMLCERIDAPTVTTMNAKGVFPESHPLSVGPSIRLPAAHALLEEADVVLVVGSRLGTAETWDAELEFSGRLIRVDIDPAVRDRNAACDVFLNGDASDVLSTLGALVRDRPDARRSSGPERARAARAAVLSEALVDGGQWRAINEQLQAAMPDDTIVAGDSAQVSYFGTAHFWPMDHPGFLYPTNFATLGYGLPAAIGAKLGCADRPVMALVGDGGFVFTAPELSTAVDQRLPIPIVVVSNGGYGEIRDGMVERGIPALGVDFDAPDFAGLARACGAHGRHARDPSEAAAMAAAALSADRPTVIQLDV